MQLSKAPSATDSMLEGMIIEVIEDSLKEYAAISTTDLLSISLGIETSVLVPVYPVIVTIPSDSEYEKSPNDKSSALAIIAGVVKEDAVKTEDGKGVIHCILNVTAASVIPIAREKSFFISTSPYERCYSVSSSIS